jgi:hypothetical protein
MNDLNWYLMNKDHDFNSVAAGGAAAGKGVHLIGVNPPPGGSNEDKLNKFAKIKPSMSRERVGLVNPNSLLINLQNYNFKQQQSSVLLVNPAAVGGP